LAMTTAGLREMEGFSGGRMGTAGEAGAVWDIAGMAVESAKSRGKSASTPIRAKPARLGNPGCGP